MLDLRLAKNRQPGENKKKEQNSRRVVENLGALMVKICNHCKNDIAIRNPSGYCDHLKYPDYCRICKAITILAYQRKLLQGIDQRLFELMNETENLIKYLEGKND